MLLTMLPLLGDTVRFIFMKLKCPIIFLTIKKMMNKEGYFNSQSLVDFASKLNDQPDFRRQMHDFDLVSKGHFFSLLNYRKRNLDFSKSD